MYQDISLQEEHLLSCVFDGKAFHTFTRGIKKPFDTVLMNSMHETCKFLCANIQGCKMAYTQSDEISLLLTDYETITTDSWFDYGVQKMVSVAASMATLAFNTAFSENVLQWAYGKPQTDENEKLASIYLSKTNKALFDARVFSLPKEEVCNYFVWRQQDATRNSIQALAYANFSNKETFGLNCNELQEKLFSVKGINWNDLPITEKRGACIVKVRYMKEVEGQGLVMRTKWNADMNIPIFTQDRYYIDKYVYIEE